MQILTIQHALQTYSGVHRQQGDTLKSLNVTGGASHLSGFGWGLNKGNAVAAC